MKTETVLQRILTAFNALEVDDDNRHFFNEYEAAALIRAEYEALWVMVKLNKQRAGNAELRKRAASLAAHAMRFMVDLT